MPLEYKQVFNPGEHLWPVALKLSESEVFPNDRIRRSFHARNAANNSAFKTLSLR